MHNGNPDGRRNFADRRQALRGALPAPASGDAVHGSQIENYRVPAPAGRAMSAVIAAYTLLSRSSVAVPARVLRRAGSPRSASNRLIVAGS